MTPFHLLVLAVAVFRATRLLTTDTITDKARSWLHGRAWVTNRRHDIDGRVLEERTDRRDGRRTEAFLDAVLSCVWCTTVWVSGLAIGVFLNWQTPTLDVAYVLACSAVAAVLSERT